MNSRSVIILSATCMSLVSSGFSHAISNSNVIILSDSLDKNIKQSIAPSFKPSFSKKEKVTSDGDNVSIGHLNSISVYGSENISRVAKDFFRERQGVITEKDLSMLNEIISREIRRSGYLAYFTIDYKKISGGLFDLNINVVTPSFQELNFISNDKELLTKYEPALTKEFDSVLVNGKPVDIQYLDSILISSEVYRPIKLNANLKKHGENSVDVDVDVKEVQSEPLSFNNAFAQINNYGLKSYGHAQLIAGLSIKGLTPNSLLNAIALKSQRATYAKLDYAFPTETLRGVVNLWGAYSDGRTNYNSIVDTNQDTNNLGVSLKNNIYTLRGAILTSELSYESRQTRNELQYNNIKIQDVRDNKVRLSFELSNRMLSSSEPFSYEVALTRGKYIGEHDYFKGELLGDIYKNITDNGQYFATARFKGQWASDSLDSYDKISLGGINGVRAYTTNDGVGDTGIVMSLDIYRRILSNYYIGLFYDAGIVKPNKNNIDGLYNKSYTLQGVGLEAGGYLDYGVSFNAAVAHGVGSYDAYVSGVTESKPRDVKFLLSVTKSF